MLPALIDCQNWTDNTGITHDIVSQTVDSPAGDESVLLEDILSDNGSSYDHDYAFYRVGRVVGFITALLQVTAILLLFLGCGGPVAWRPSSR